MCQELGMRLWMGGCCAKLPHAAHQPCVSSCISAQLWPTLESCSPQSFCSCFVHRLGSDISFRAHERDLFGARDMKNTSQPLTEMPGFKPRGCSVCEHPLQYFKAEMPIHAVQLQGLWHLYLLWLITCSGEQSHNIPQSIMRLKQMACHIELLHQRDKEKVFNLLQLHRASSYSLATESLKTKGRQTSQWAGIKQKQLGHFTLVTAFES